MFLVQPTVAQRQEDCRKSDQHESYWATKPHHKGNLYPIQRKSSVFGASTGSAKRAKVSPSTSSERVNERLVLFSQPEGSSIPEARRAHPESFAVLHIDQRKALLMQAHNESHTRDQSRSSEVYHKKASLKKPTWKANVWEHWGHAFFEDVEAFLPLSSPSFPLFIVVSVGVAHFDNCSQSKTWDQFQRPRASVEMNKLSLSRKGVNHTGSKTMWISMGDQFYLHRRQERRSATVVHCALTSISMQKVFSVFATCYNL